MTAGSVYGGWWVPPHPIERAPVCYLAGVGTDITFDWELISRFGCEVWALDPTPAVVEWVARQPVPAGFHFLPVGLAGQSCRRRFYGPANASHVSHSLTNLQGTSTFFEADCLTARDVMVKLGHASVDLLKMDVEGAEFEVIGSLVRDEVLPGVICIEMDHPRPAVCDAASYPTGPCRGLPLLEDRSLQHDLRADGVGFGVAHDRNSHPMLGRARCEANRDRSSASHRVAPYDSIGA